MKKPAILKQEDIWSNIIATKDKSGAFPSALKLPGIFVERMDPTFSGKGDTMPSDLLGTRVKYIHSVAAHGKVKFVSTKNHPYTGIFKGADHGIIRLSSAA